MSRFSGTGELIVDPTKQESPTEREEAADDKAYLYAQQREQDETLYRAGEPSPWSGVQELPVIEARRVDWKYPYSNPRPDSDPANWRTPPAAARKRRGSPRPTPQEQEEESK